MPWLFPPTEAPVLAALARMPGVHCAEHIAMAAGLKYDAVSSMLRRLEREGKARYVGNANELCRNEVHGATRFYALAEAQPIKLPGPIADEIRVAQKITVGRGSFWGAGLA